MSQNSSNRRKLKNFLINPSYQLKYVLLLATVGVALSAVYGSVFYIYTRENYTILVDLAPMTDQVKLQLYSELKEIVFYLSLFSAAFVLATCLVAVAVTHRAAGPIYHFKKVFDQIRSGNAEVRVRLRPTDDFQDAAESFNGMMDSLTRKASGTQSHEDEHAA